MAHLHLLTRNPKPETRNCTYLEYPLRFFLLWEKILLDDLKVFLGNKLATGVQAEFVTSGAGEHERSNIEPKIVSLEAIVNFNRREFSFSDHLILIQVYQLNFKFIGSEGIRETKVDSHLRMLTGKGFGPQVSEGPDNTFLAGQAVDDDGVTN